MFQTVVEMHSHQEWHVYTDVAKNVDALLAGTAAPVQLRKNLSGKMLVRVQEFPSQGSKLKTYRNHDNWFDDLLHISKSMLVSQ